MSDFWLGKQEKDEFKEKAVMLNKVTDIINEANQKGLKAGISQNKDGSFSARSNIGKEIRNTLEKYEPIKTSLNNDLYNLQNLPIYRWEAFNKYVKNKKAFMWSFALWCCVLLSYNFALGKQSIAQLFYVYLAIATNFFRNEKNRLALSDDDIQMVVVTTAIAIITYFLFRLIFKKSGTKYSPYPEKVSVKNVDSY